MRSIFINKHMIKGIERTTALIIVQLCTPKKSTIIACGKEVELIQSKGTRNRQRNFFLIRTDAHKNKTTDNFRLSGRCTFINSVILSKLMAIKPTRVLMCFLFPETERVKSSMNSIYSLYSLNFDLNIFQILSLFIWLWTWLKNTLVFCAVCVYIALKRTDWCKHFPFIYQYKTDVQCISWIYIAEAFAEQMWPHLTRMEYGSNG